MIRFIASLAFCSLIVWMLITYVVKMEPFRTIVIAVAVICMILYTMQAFGIMDVPLPQF